jgi:hypothetical protein
MAQPALSRYSARADAEKLCEKRVALRDSCCFRSGSPENAGLSRRPSVQEADARKVFEFAIETVVCSPGLAMRPMLDNPIYSPVMRTRFRVEATPAITCTRLTGTL